MRLVWVALIVLFSVVSISPGAAANLSSEQKFFQTVTEDRLHWIKCMKRAAGVMVTGSQTPAGTAIVQWKREDESGVIVYVSTQAHVISEGGNEKSGAVYDKIFVEFRYEPLPASLIAIDREIDLALLKVFIPKKPPANRSSSATPYDAVYRSIMENLEFVRYDSGLNPANLEEGALMWMVGYSNGSFPRRILARFFGWISQHSLKAAGGRKLDILFFVFEQGPVFGGHSGGVILDFTCENVVGVLYRASDMGEAISAFTASTLKQFVAEGLRKEGISFP